MTPSPTLAPWLTVVIPSYRGERWIEEALNSLVVEATREVEIIVVDGSPNSATRDIARSYSDRLRLRVFERADFASWHAKTNFAVEQAQASHVCWLGVDDVWLRGRLAAVHDWIEDAPEASLHLAPAAIIGKEGEKLGVWRCPLRADRELQSAAVTKRLLVQNFVAAPAPVFRKDAWLRCGGLDESLWYTADWDMWLRLAALHPVRYHQKVTIGFRVHAGSITMAGRRNPADFERQMNIVLNRHLPKLGDGSPSLERAARASIAVNAALALASTGDFSALFGAASQVLNLGPAGIRRYFRDSRIVERLVPRVRARLMGAL